jgi:ABC-type Fe3+-siderophore transport system permease subunit
MRMLFAVFVVVALACGLLFGSTPLSVSRALTDADSIDRALFVSLRVPRVLLGFITGGGLALVGGVLQTTLRNPLADPFVLGVSGGAALFASIAMLLGLGASTSLVLPLCALVGGMLASVLVLALVRDRSRGGDYPAEDLGPRAEGADAVVLAHGVSRRSRLLAACGRRVLCGGGHGGVYASCTEVELVEPW